MQACWKESGRLGGAEAVDRQPVLADALGERQEVAVRRHDPEAVDIAAIEQVHRVDGHAHVGRALALDDVELLHRDDRVGAGQIAPALEAGLGPIAVGAADVDRAELAKHQQHFVEMVGRGIVGVDQQGDIGFLLERCGRAFANSFFCLSSAASRNDHSLARRLFRS